jgi:hypothetical protein
VFCRYYTTKKKKTKLTTFEEKKGGRTSLPVYNETGRYTSVGLAGDKLCATDAIRTVSTNQDVPREDFA